MPAHADAVKLAAEYLKVFVEGAPPPRPASIPPPTRPPSEAAHRAAEVALAEGEEETTLQSLEKILPQLVRAQLRRPGMSDGG